MKTRWEFFFEARGVRFERQHRFIAKGTLTRKMKDSEREVVVDCELEIVPDLEQPPLDADQTGRIRILMPGSPEETEELAGYLATSLAERIGFERGSLKVMAGLVTAERIPETQEERDTIRDTPYFARVRLVEHLGTPPFEAGSIGQSSLRPDLTPLLAQFNAAKSSARPCDRLLGLFKVLESLYCDPNRPKQALRSLQQNNELYQLARENLSRRDTPIGEPISREEFTSLLVRIVRTRHHCAHLTPRFGYAAHDPRLLLEVVPMGDVVEILAHAALRFRGGLSLEEKMSDED